MATINFIGRSATDLLSVSHALPLRALQRRGDEPSDKFPPVLTGTPETTLLQTESALVALVQVLHRQA